jgi:serine/threonine-protein kinase
VYALGAILFEMLAREPLHKGESPARLLLSTLGGVDARPSSRAPDQEIPPELDAVCVKATARDPHDRFRSARELSAAIEGYLDGDRDVAQRRKASAELAIEAAGRARAAFGAGPDSLHQRSLAMRDVSRALAFDPENAEARAILFRLLTEPPRELPPAALAEIHRLAREQQSATMRWNTVAFLVCPLLLLPFFFWLGVRSWPMFVGMCATWIAASLASLRVSRHPDPRGEASYLQIAAVALAIAGAAMILGPYVVVPSIAVVAAAGVSFSNASSRRRMISAATILLGLLAPAAAELMGLLPSSTRFQGGEITLLPRAVAFPTPATPVLLLAANILLVVAASILFTRLRTKVTNANRRLTLTTWQLEQLVPHHVRGS